MSFNLNDKSYDGSVAIFNNGIAGKVNNVKIEVLKKSSIDADNAPDYKVNFSDKIGTVNVGFYYHTPDSQKTDEKNKALEGYNVSRVLSLAKSVLPKDYVFEEYDTSKQVLDAMFKLIKLNSEDKLVNVFVTYGTAAKSSKYLGLRYFDFVEAADTEVSRLAKKPGDVMERIEADAPATTSTSTNDSSWD